MRHEPFLQGPMSDTEARELVERYRSRGIKAEISPAFNPQQKYVITILNKSAERPRRSRTFENRIWSK